MPDEKASEPSWADRSIAKMGQLLRARHESHDSSLAKTIQSLEADVAKGARAQTLLAQHVWTDDIATFVSEQEARSAIPPYRPGEEEKLTAHIEERRAYASGVSFAFQSLRDELAMWVEKGKESAKKLAAMREAEKPKPNRDAVSAA